MTAVAIGHKNPDSDSILSSIAIADLISKVFYKTTAYAQGAPTPETLFVLNRFGLQTPEIIDSVEGRKVVLVDHSDLAQAPMGIEKAEIIAVADHHKLGDLTTSSPLLMWVWPVGCTSTVIKIMYDFYGVEIPKHIAGGMLCAILSDTVIFKSPTTTDHDIKAVESLAKIAGVADYKVLGMEMFKVKSDISAFSAKELLFRDFKDFTMQGKKVGIGQLEVIDIAMLDNINNDLENEVKKAKEDGRDSVFLLLTDIMKEGSQMLIATNDSSFVQKAFNLESITDSVWLPGVMSRKKDVVPKLEKILKS